VGIPRLCLVRARGGKNRRAFRSLANQLQLHTNLRPPSPPVASPFPAPNTDPIATRVLRAKALTQQGHLGRATRVLFQDGLAPMDTNSIADLEFLHPPASDPVPLPNDAPSLQRVDPDVLASIVRRSMANGSAPAGSGWTGDLLNALVDDSDCLAGIAALVNDIINGSLPDACRPLFLSSILVGAKKSSGGIRPIAMGEAFYKLAGLYCLSLVRTDAPEIFEPIKYALSPGIRVCFTCPPSCFRSPSRLGYYFGRYYQRF
jgi:hypothetical protein